MNNARYLRELDFARADFYKRTGLFIKIKSKGGAVVQGAATIRYRKFIRPFTIFQVKSKVILEFGVEIFLIGGEHFFLVLDSLLGW